MTEVSHGILIYYILFWVFLVVLGTAFCVSVFRKYKINYQFIFELDPDYRITHHEIY